MLHLWTPSQGAQNASPVPLETPARRVAEAQSSGRAYRLGLLPSAFNPVTIAHLGLARQAIRQFALDEVLLLLPSVFPHKVYSGPTFEQRIEMLLAATSDDSKLRVGSNDRGLFIEIVQDARAVYGENVKFFLICGRDAAERAMLWDYGPDDTFSGQLHEFQMLVAPRGGVWTVPKEYASRIYKLDFPLELQVCSSSAVREAIAAGRDWENLVPAPVAAIIRREQLYSSL
jgi:nicotinate-nucleotide adenylyltransferase